MAALTHKRGTSFLAQVTATVGGVPLDLTSLTITSQVRARSFDPASPGVLVANPVAVTIVNALAGRFNVGQLDTSPWPVAMLEWDIRFADAAGKLSSTQTVDINSVHEVTR